MFETQVCGYCGAPVRDVSAALDRFQKPTTSYATLGVNPATAWLHIPVEVDPGSNGDWILDIDYAPLDVVDVFVQRGADIAQLAEIMRRNRGRHPDGNAVRTIGKQVGHGRRQYQRLLVFPIIG